MTNADTQGIPTEDSQASQLPIEKMTVRQLRDELYKKNLLAVGKKKILQDRLQKTIENNTNKSEPELTDNDSNNKEIKYQKRRQCKTQLTKRTKGQQPRRRGTAQIGRREREQEIKSESEDSQDSQDEDEDETQRRQHGLLNEQGTVLINHMTNAFTIKDIEGSIPTFSGDDKMNIHSWIEKFEDMSVLLRWNDLQKVIYGKKMLRRSTK